MHGIHANLCQFPVAAEQVATGVNGIGEELAEAGLSGPVQGDMCLDLRSQRAGKSTAP